MANPQAEHGHVDIANEIVDRLCSYRLSGEEWQVLLVVLRKTYGWHKKQDAISLSQFAELTGIARSSIVRAINKLVTKKLLLSYKNVTSVANVYEFNKDFDSWGVVTKKLPSYNKVNKGSYKKVNKVVTKKLHTKETIQKKTIQKKTYLDFVFLSEEEHSKLQNKLGSRLSGILEHLNAKIGQNEQAFNKRYKSHYYTILNWEKLGVFANIRPKSEADFL